MWGGHCHLPEKCRNVWLKEKTNTPFPKDCGNGGSCRQAWLCGRAGLGVHLFILFIVRFSARRQTGHQARLSVIVNGSGERLGIGQILLPRPRAKLLKHGYLKTGRQPGQKQA
jgi:hypothetical protein